MGAEEKKRGEKDRRELLRCLRRLAKWKSNDVVKLLFLDPEDPGGVDGLDLSGVTELKRNANGTFEVKLVDRVKVLDMLRQLLAEQDDGVLESFMEQIRYTGDGDEA